ncbi:MULTISPECIES: DUF4429 domain-containing protein [Actinokineospora]|uniref:Tat pathway signal sequence domain protein n=1 Tax=Actinokineospora fastidiosa TaxID=1816 RepID=A0A918LGA6_9PSEU|nr:MULTISPECIES: DUF4429 domain-containing protein [Actinokineospora]UVS77518.1 hypothetical protein Actkin_01229 [Actinokineospora sp. UTMC 2448]GGS42744.1 hypothetical protein GCM10010171_42210 [Actinokineospora fastidiosa]
MAEVTTAEGTWGFDGAALRITPGTDRKVHKLRKALGELVVPAAAIAGISYEPGKKGGALRARLREGADPLSQVVGGHLPEQANPYRLAVDPAQVVNADYLVEAFRFTPRAEGDGPVGRFLLPGPALPVSATVSEAVVSFDGSRVLLEWSWQAPDVKRRSGTQELPIDKVTAVVWRPSSGLTDGVLRFIVRDASPNVAPTSDLHAVRLTWGTENELLTALVAAAVVARIPRSRPDAPAAAPPDVDVLMRRLRELGDLRDSGVLTEDEFTAAKRAVLRSMSAEEWPPPQDG